MRYRGFLPCPDPFLECQRFVNLHFIRARSSLILFFRIVPLLYITLFVGMVERKKKIVDGEWGEEYLVSAGKYTLEKLGEWATYDKRTLTYQVKIRLVISTIRTQHRNRTSNIVWKNDHNNQYYILSKKV